VSNYGYRFGYQGSEKDNEFKGDGNSYTTEFRQLDPRLGRWLSVDPLIIKFPAYSPYVFCNNSTNNIVDTEGKEGIVVSGSPGDHINKEHFLVNGLDRAKAAKKHTQRKGEIVTWIIYDDPTEGQGYSYEQLIDYRAKAEAAGIHMMVVTDVDEIVDYVNEKNGGDLSDPGSRARDKITSFYYVGHAYPGDLWIGYKGSNENFEPDDFEPEAFSNGCHVNLVGGCRTAIADWFEDSAVEQFSEILDKTSNVYGSNVKTYYPGGVATDEELLKKNHGKIILSKGQLPSSKKKK
jgi:RHS repeat-associated protein